MPDCLSYTLFGYGQANKDSFEFRSYLRGFHLNLRIAQLLYHGYAVYLTVDQPTYNSIFKKYFDALHNDGLIVLNVVPSQPLCRMMLQRLNPIFTDAYTRVLCRDADSLLQYRERQAVQYYTQKDHIAHGITDSISHNVALMGGMCGFKAADIRILFNCQTLDCLLGHAPGIDYTIKGSDQDFLNRIILPRIANSFTEHYVKGMPNSFRDHYHSQIDDVDVGLPPHMRETDNLGWHIGASGFQVDATVKFLQLHGLNNEYFNKLEQPYPAVFYWQL